MLKEESDQEKPLKTNDEEKTTEETIETEETKIEPLEELEEEAVIEETAEIEKEKEAKSQKEEAKPSKEEEIVEEKIYTVPLGKAWIMPPRKRAPRAIHILKDFVIKHMKLEKRKETEEEEEETNRLIISNEVNLALWKKGIEKPPRKIRIRAAKDKEGDVTVYLAE